MPYLPCRFVSLLVCAAMLGVTSSASAGATATVPAQTKNAPPDRAEAQPKLVERDILQWLARLQEASRKTSYVGTFVVSAADGSMASSRIWHACDGGQQVERIESLTGTPRSVFRRNEQVITFLPASRIVKIEHDQSANRFPAVGLAGSSEIARHYTAQLLGQERVAGFEADVVWLQPRDALRFGYKVWSEKKTGLVIILQTLAPDGKVLEQAAFSELDMRNPVKADKLAQLMTKTAGYQIIQSDLVRTTASDEGWQLKTAVPGFQPMGCHKHPLAPSKLEQPAGSQPGAGMQWTFSDGLATVSLFVEPFDAQRHQQERELTMGATQLLMKRVAGDWWLTAVGEVPPQTLRLFSQSLQRRALAAH